MSQIDKIRELIHEADQSAEKKQYKKALILYREAVSLVPEPFAEQDISTELITAIGDVHFLLGEYDKANKAFKDVMLCPDATANAYIRLRRGQLAFESNDIKKARIELACAYMNGGEKVFEDEDPKYIEFIEPIIKKAK